MEVVLVEVEVGSGESDVCNIKMLPAVEMVAVAAEVDLGGSGVDVGTLGAGAVGDAIYLWCRCQPLLWLCLFACLLHVTRVKGGEAPSSPTPRATIEPNH